MKQALAIAMLSVFALPACAQTEPKAGSPPERAPNQAKALLKDAKGRDAGSATFTEGPQGVKLKLNVLGLDPGKHGFHIHEKGICEPPDFKSAGAHFNPHGKQHGHANQRGPHAGDLPNLVASAEGTASTEVTIPDVTLRKGEKHSLLDGDGSALVVHAKADDEKSDPAGNSGDRVICGIVAGDGP